MRTHNRKLKFVALYPTTGDMQAVFEGDYSGDVVYRNVPKEYDVPEWLQHKLSALFVLHGGFVNVPRYGVVTYQAHVPDEHADMWGELLSAEAVMRDYVVVYCSGLDGEEDEYFECQADNNAHAMEQCKNAYPDADILCAYEKDIRYDIQLKEESYANT
jgi:hypothetical protein